jgi:hypothetical protein
MNEKKLTAKLSDGREMEVLESEFIIDSNGPRLYLRPIKREPPKELWADIYAGEVGAAYAQKEIDRVPSDIKPRLVRYVLAEDLKEGAPLVDAYRDLGRLSRKEPKVYHLHFRRNGKLLRVLGPIEKDKAALLFEDQEHKDEYADEVVRVRQSLL